LVAFESIGEFLVKTGPQVQKAPSRILSPNWGLLSHGIATFTNSTGKPQSRRWSPKLYPTPIESTLTRARRERYWFLPDICQRKEYFYIQTFVAQQGFHRT
jgi:hypothetical protein